MFRAILASAIIAGFAVPAFANGNPGAGRELVLQSCTTCHATNSASVAADAAPPLSEIAKDNRQDKTWIDAWLLNPHRAMAGIMLSRQQIDDVMAYLNTLPTG